MKGEAEDKEDKDERRVAGTMTRKRRNNKGEGSRRGRMVG